MKKHWSYALGASAIAFILGMSLVLPIFDRKPGLGVFNDISDNGSNVMPLGEQPEPPIVSPFIYVTTYPPVNSFGASSFTEQFVNWSWIEEHTSYNLTCDGSDKNYLFSANFSYVFTHRKYSYSFTSDVQGYYEFTLVFDSKANGSWIDWVNHTVFFNYSMGEQLFYNFSDIWGVVGQFDSSFSLVNGVFTMVLGRTCNKNVVVVLDPIMGNTIIDTNVWLCQFAVSKEYIYGFFYTTEADGYADNISIRTDSTWNDDCTIQCALYTYVDNSSEYAGNRIAVTETKLVPSGTTNTIVSCNFSEPRPFLYSGTNYYILVRPVGDYTQNSGISSRSGGYTVYTSSSTGVTFDDPWNDDSKTTGEIYITCSYSPNVTTSVDSISPYWQDDVTTVVLNATTENYPDEVELWYRYSEDNSSWTGGTDYTNDTVDNAASNVDSNNDIGTESNFANCQDVVPDADVMTLEETDKGTAGSSYNSAVDDNTADKDSDNDRGTESDFNNCKGTTIDGSVMTLQEANIASAAVNEYQYVDSGSSPALTEWETESGTSPWIDADDSNYIHEDKTASMEEGWFDFDDTSETGTGFTVQFEFLCYGDDGDDGFAVHYNNGGGDTNLGTFVVPQNGGGYQWTAFATTLTGQTATQINNLQMLLDTVMNGGGDDIYVDACRIHITRAGSANYSCDFEYQFEDVDFNKTTEELCIYTAAHGGENLVVQDWDGSSWSNVGTITGTGWSNFSTTLTSGVYNIRLYDATNSSDTGQTSWTIDAMSLNCSTPAAPNYTMDFEYQFTDVQFNDTTENICFYIASHGGEDLHVQRWDGTGWSNLGTITSTGWTNMTANGLDSGTYTIRLYDDDNTSDTGQDTWTIDVLKLFTSEPTGAVPFISWTDTNHSNNPDTLAPFSWQFDAPNSTGYYEFYSICKKAGYDDETAPGVADARCHINITQPYEITWQVINNTINGSFTNTTIWHILDDTINGSFVNTTTWCIIDDTINGTFANTTEWTEIDNTINGSFTNITTFKIIDDSINGSFTNSTSYHIIDNTYNGTFGNFTDIWQIIDDAINGSFTNLTSWVAFDTTYNGSFVNSTEYRIINDTINGSFTNLTEYRIISDSINGSFENTTTYHIISDMINGSFTNTSVASWQIIDDTYNGSFTNTTAWIIISDTYNGSFVNSTEFRIISDTTNGSFTNVTEFRVIDDTINGEFGNYTDIWQIISNTYNGSFVNNTEFRIVDDTINGSFINTIEFRIISDTINGEFSNASTWNLIDDTINGSFTNITSYHIIDNTYNGEFANLSDFWRTIDNTYNGTFGNYSASWNIIDDTYNGEFTNTSTYHIIDDTYNGEFTNTSTYHIIDDTYNGSFYNGTAYHIISGTINGSFTNITSYHIISSSINGSFSNLTSYHIISSSINGSFINVSTKYYHTIVTINGSFTNTTTYHILIDTLNGTFTNATSYHIISDTINGSFTSITSYQIIKTITGVFTNTTQWNIIDDTINGEFYNVVIGPRFGTPSPANNSEIYTTNVNFSILLNDSYIVFNWTIESNTGDNNSGTLDTNGTKYLTLPSLNYTTYTVWVNITDGFYNQGRWFVFTVSEGYVTGSFIVIVDGQVITLIPTLGGAVDYFKWEIENKNLANTDWIDADEITNKLYTLDWDDTYKVTLWFKNETITRSFSDVVHMPSNPNYTAPDPIVEPKPVPRYKNIFDDTPSGIKIWFEERSELELGILAIPLIVLFLLFARKKHKRVIISRRKEGNKNEKRRRK